MGLPWLWRLSSHESFFHTAYNIVQQGQITLKRVCSAQLHLWDASMLTLLVLGQLPSLVPNHTLLPLSIHDEHADVVVMLPWQLVLLRHLAHIWTSHTSGPESTARQLSQDVRKSRSSMNSMHGVGVGPLETTPSLNSDVWFLNFGSNGRWEGWSLWFNLHLPGGSQNYSFSSVFARPSFLVTAGLYLSPLLLQCLFFCFLRIFSAF